MVEGANMPTEPDAVDALLDANVLFGPGKAANAGGVAVSGLEMSQNSILMSWSREEVDEKLQTIMSSIHDSCESYGKEGDFINYVRTVTAVRIPINKINVCARQLSETFERLDPKTSKTILFPQS